MGEKAMKKDLLLLLLDAEIAGIIAVVAAILYMI